MKILQREMKIHLQIQMIILHLNRILMMKIQNVQIGTKIKHSTKHSMKHLMTMKIFKIYSNQHLDDE